MTIFYKDSIDELINRLSSAPEIIEKIKVQYDRLAFFKVSGNSPVQNYSPYPNLNLNLPIWLESGQEFHLIPMLHKGESGVRYPLELFLKESNFLSRFGDIFELEDSEHVILFDNGITTGQNPCNCK